MAPPRLPQEYALRLIAILLAVPSVAHRGRRGWDAFMDRAQLPRDKWEWLDCGVPSPTVATQMIGSAANLVPLYDGPRRGWTDLGGILAAVLPDPALTPEDRAYIAALIVRYKLLPLDAPDLAPDLRTLLATVPPQPPPFYPLTMPNPSGGAAPPG